MLKHALSVVKKAKLKTDPFPYIFVKNLLPKKELLRLNKILPSFNEVGGNDVLYQSSSKTKKTLLKKLQKHKKPRPKKLLQHKVT